MRFFEKYYDVHAFDFKGFGDNKGMDFPYALDDYVAETKEYMYKHSLDKPFVVAHSFGARVAVKFAGEWCGEIEPFSRIVLTGPAGLKPRFSLKKAVKRKTFKLLKRFLSEEKRERFYSPDYRALSPIMRKSFIKIVNEHLDDCAKKIQVPTLIITGENDKETPLYMARRYNAYIKNSRLKIIKNAGHFAFVDKPYVFCREVLAFFTDNLGEDL